MALQWSGPLNTRYFFQNQGGAKANIEETVTGLGIGDVIESKSSAFPAKSLVLGFSIGWEQYTHLSSTRLLWAIPDAHNPKISHTEYVNALGINGLTAYAAVETLVKFKKNQVVYISSTAGPFDIALEKLKPNGQVVAIGNISASGAKRPYVTKNLNLITTKAVTINGFNTFHI
ncbi:Prostaglandin reductase 1 [Mortierella sp. AD094]|nr:Prostaglandin reductase 1 [Mortierella sp. AD094]